MRTGTICFATHQGIGYLPKWFYDAGLVTDVLTLQHGSRTNHPEWYMVDGRVLDGRGYHGELVSRPFSGPLLDSFLSKLDLVLFFETPFDWSFLKYCRDRWVRTAIVGMYECTPQVRPYEPDAWISPSALDLRYFPGSKYLPIPVTPEVEWKRRTTVRSFVHNAGNLGLKGRNGTDAILAAWRHVRSNAALTLRAQDRVGLERAVSRFPTTRNDSRIRIDTSDVPHDRLFADHDALITAERWNGLSLPLQEAFAAGMVVVTPDRFPANDWLPSDPLIPVRGYRRTRASGGCYDIDEAVVAPEDIAATVDRLYGTDCRQLSDLGRVYRDDMSWTNLRPAWEAHLREIAGK